MSVVKLELESPHHAFDPDGVMYSFWMKASFPPWWNMTQEVVVLAEVHDSFVS
jgi:hypothetical protein